MASVSEPAQAPPPRILVVDDDVAIRGTVQRYLRQYQVDVADCVEAALAHIDRHSYDLLLVDRRLPDGLGDRVVDEVHRRRWSLPVIMMSGEIDPQLFRDRGEVRPDDFIEKPFVREALINKIERLLTAHALRTQASRQRAELADMHQRHDREVDVARTIFDRIFARGDFDPAHVRHLVVPADRLAGDVVFGARIGADRYRWMIGDVTGHTLSSALVTISLAGLFYRTARELVAMTSVLEKMERELFEILPANMFCVAAMCELDRASGTLAVWNGGNPDLLIRHTTGRVTQIPSMALPLAADRFSLPNHTSEIYQVGPGDRTYAFSDGLIELRDPAQQMIGSAQLLDIVRAARPEDIFDQLRALIPDRGGASAPDDDISLIEVIV
jgi:serine phosphatase RsbU (regulator of sigma subunit)